MILSSISWVLMTIALIIIGVVETIFWLTIGIVGMIILLPFYGLYKGLKGLTQ